MFGIWKENIPLVVKSFLDITPQIQWILHHQKLSFHTLMYMMAEENHSLLFFLQRYLISFCCSAFQAQSLQMHFAVQYPRKVVSSENLKNSDFQIHETCHLLRKNLVINNKKENRNKYHDINMKYLDINKNKNN